MLVGLPHSGRETERHASHEHLGTPNLPPADSYSSGRLPAYGRRRLRQDATLSGASASAPHATPGHTVSGRNEAGYQECFCSCKLLMVLSLPPDLALASD